MTPEEIAALTKQIGETVTTTVNAAVAPISAQIKTLQDGHKTLADQLTANTRAEEESMRATVTEKFGALVANALTGEPLKEMFKKCGTAVGVTAGTTGTKPVTGAPDPAAHFGGVK